MTKLGRLCGILLLLTSTALMTGCSQADLDHFYGRDVAAGSSRNPEHGTRPVVCGAAGKREANMRAVNEQNYRNQMQNYQRATPTSCRVIDRGRRSDKDAAGSAQVSACHASGDPIKPRRTLNDLHQYRRP